MRVKTRYLLPLLLILFSALAFANSGDTTFDPLTTKANGIINGSGAAAAIAICFILTVIYFLSGGGMRAVTNMIGFGVFLSVGYTIMKSFIGGSVEVVHSNFIDKVMNVQMDFRLLIELLFAFGYFWLLIQNRKLQKKIKELKSEKR